MQVPLALHLTFLHLLAFTTAFPFKPSANLLALSERHTTTSSSRSFCDTQTMGDTTYVQGDCSGNSFSGKVVHGAPPGQSNAQSQPPNQDSGTGDAVDSMGPPADATDTNNNNNGGPNSGSSGKTMTDNNNNGGGGSETSGKTTTNNNNNSSSRGKTTTNNNNNKGGGASASSTSSASHSKSTGKTTTNNNNNNSGGGTVTNNNGAPSSGDHNGNR